MNNINLQIIQRTKISFQLHARMSQVLLFISEQIHPNRERERERERESESEIERECVCARVRVCVCVCVWERERERERDHNCSFLNCFHSKSFLAYTVLSVCIPPHTHTHTHTHTHIYICIELPQGNVEVAENPTLYC